MTTSVSDTVLDETPARVVKFLGAAGTNAAINGVLAKRGYTREVNDQGWQLLFKACGYRPLSQPSIVKPEAVDAIAEIDAWDEPNFKVARAALQGEFSAQREFVFAGLEAGERAASVLAVRTFLDRLDELESAPARESTRTADLAALAKLAGRGITAAVRAHLRARVAVATVATEPAAPPNVESPAGSREARIALRVWFEEWSEIAKADIKRRDYLVSLGLAKRKTNKKPKGDAQS